MFPDAHHAQKHNSPREREAQHVSCGQPTANALRHSDASPRRLWSDQLSARLLERLAAPRQLFRILSFPRLEVGTAVDHRQRSIADVGIEATELRLGDRQ